MTKNPKQTITNIPPQDIDVEKAVLGALINESRAMDLISGKITSEAFYDTKNKKVFKAISDLYASNDPIDLLTVVNRLKQNGTLESVSQMYVVTISQSAASSAHIEKHAMILVEYFLKRLVIDLCRDGLSKAFSKEVVAFDLIDLVGSGIDSISDTISTGHSSMTWQMAMRAIPQRVEFLTNNQGKVTGLPTGLVKLDKHFSGWQPTDFIVIGADSGMGKTAFVMCSMLAAAKNGDPVGMFSMEMSVSQLAIRATATESHFHMNQLSRNGFEKDEYFTGLNETVGRLESLPMHIDDKPALTVPEMKRKARAMKRKHGIKLLVIDFLQMFSGDKEVRINVGEAARECKNMAKELNIPVIALSQLSREVRKQKNMIPQKYHLKEASTIEEAADVICLLYRPGYYGFTPESHPDLYQNELGLQGDENAALMVAKNRNGALGNVGLRYIEDKTKYVDGSDMTQSFVTVDPMVDGSPF